MAGKIINVVLDTNVLISGVAFGGKPREILDLLIIKEISGITSPVLLAELEEVLFKKFKYPKARVLQVDKKMRKILRVVHPVKSIKVVRDDDDNRVLEAAVEGEGEFIVTGDEDLLDLKNYGKIKIMTPTEFLKEEAWKV